MIHYIIEYIFIAIAGVVLWFMSREIYRMAFKGEKKSTLLKTIFFSFLVVFVCPLVYFAAFLIQHDLKEYNQGANYQSIRFGYINKTGKTVIPFIYDSAGPFEHGYALVRKDNVSFWIDSLGNKAKNQNLNYFNKPNLRNEYKNSGESCTDDQFDKYTLLEGKITVIDSASEGLKVVRLIKRTWESNQRYHYVVMRWGYEDTTGTIVVKPAFQEAYSFHEGLAVVDDTTKEPESVSGLKMGFINHAGLYVIPPIYEYAEDFCEGKAAVSKVTSK